MKCYFTKDPKTKRKVLIPGCWSVVNSGEKEDCTCSPNNKSFESFEKERFNKILSEKNRIIQGLESEIEHLNKIIENENP